MGPIQTPLSLDILAKQDINNPITRVFQPFFLDMETTETLILQMVPIELNYDPGMQWNTVNSPGRNNPLYQYTGAEDSLNFVINWYANIDSREDVLSSCKWLESRSKNNGYENKPPRIKFMFGRLFNEADWIIFDARYKLSMFNRVKGLLPCLAVQEVILKRVMTTNRTSAQIRKIDT